MADKKIDPRHYMPPIEGFEPADADVSNVRGYSDPDDGGGAGGGGDIPDSLLPPGNLYVVDEVFRRAPDGRTVVDLIFEVDHVPGAAEYEIRRAST